MRFSIVIPTYNRPQRLEKCIESATLLEYPRHEFEVVVVDDGSPQPMAPVLARFEDKLSLRVIRQQNQGPAAARNRGLAEARGQYIAYTDDDCCPAPDWLTKLSTALEANPGAAVGGHAVNALEHNPYSTASQLLIDYLYEYFNRAAAGASFFASNNLAFPAEPLRALKAFDTSFRAAAGEDRELCDRWIRAGNRLVYAPDAIILHSHHLDLRSFWRQHYTYGRAAVQFHKARAAASGGKRQLEPLSFYSDLVTYPQRKATSGNRLLLSALMAVSQAANATGYFREKLFS